MLTYTLTVKMTFAACYGPDALCTAQGVAGC